MPIPLPNLDDLRFEDLLEEARRMIPGLAPEWTNHNPSDAGITLIELFAWLTEMLLYRINRIPDSQTIKFLKLINGPEWSSKGDVPGEIRDSVVRLNRRYRAVTCEDYEVLSKETSGEIGRIKCIPDRYLGSSIESERKIHRPGHVSIIVIPKSESSAPQPTGALRQEVREYLEPRRILTTRNHVVGPVYAPFGLEMILARRADKPAKDLHEEIIALLVDRFHPLTGGQDGTGWPFGHDIYISELYELLENIDGVDYIPDIALYSDCRPEDRRCVGAAGVWNNEGELIGLEIADHHLPQLRVKPEEVLIGIQFVTVMIKVQASRAASVAPSLAYRAVNTALRDLFSPFKEGPGRNWRTASWTVQLSMMRKILRELPEIDDDRVVEVSLESSPNRLIRNEAGEVTGLRFEDQELADLQIETTIA
jgi:hypothetical protein